MPRFYERRVHRRLTVGIDGRCLYSTDHQFVVPFFGDIEEWILSFIILDTIRLGSYCGDYLISVFTILTAIKITMQLLLLSPRIF
jgi:hypothetical protein